MDQSPLEYGLDEIMELVPKQYFHIVFRKNWETGKLEFDPDVGQEDIGLIAQEVWGIIPEAAGVPEDETKDIWTVDYSKITTVLVKAVQEQQEEIEQQNLAIRTLQMQIQTQSSLINEQQAITEKLLHKIESLERRR